MRVDIGIILSVLSFSSLAKVIPNGGYNGPLLVRRAVGPDTTDLLWKRADGDDEQDLVLWTRHVLSDAEADVETSNNAEAGAGASSDDSSPDHPSGSGELSELDQTSDSDRGSSIGLPRNTCLLIGQRYIPRSDKESIQKAVTKVTEAFEEGATDQQSLTKEMHGIHKSGNYIVKEFLRIVEIAISSYHSKPPKDDEGATWHQMVDHIHAQFYQFLHDLTLCALVSKVGSQKMRHMSK
ncbi:hypothetical protein BASA61_006841 [Batrachochytrium salamandrivorans]|nr:hypothetical protein BASA61_006841 [Batrachochytrium salamandrivorans]